MHRRWDIINTIHGSQTIRIYYKMRYHMTKKCMFSIGWKWRDTIICINYACCTSNLHHTHLPQQQHPHGNPFIVYNYNLPSRFTCNQVYLEKLFYLLTDYLKANQIKSIKATFSFHKIPTQKNTQMPTLYTN